MGETPTSFSYCHGSCDEGLPYFPQSHRCGSERMVPRLPDGETHSPKIPADCGKLVVMRYRIVSMVLDPAGAKAPRMFQVSVRSVRHTGTSSSNFFRAWYFSRKAPVCYNISHLFRIVPYFVIFTWVNRIGSSPRRRLIRWSRCSYRCPKKSTRVVGQVVTRQASEKGDLRISLHENQATVHPVLI